MRDLEKETWIVKREGNRVYARDGNVLFQCQFCRDVGKPMFFAAEADLHLHILRLHTGQPIK